MGLVLETHWPNAARRGGLTKHNNVVGLVHWAEAKRSSAAAAALCSWKVKSRNLGGPGGGQSSRKEEEFRGWWRRVPGGGSVTCPWCLSHVVLGIPVRALFPSPGSCPLAARNYDIIAIFPQHPKKKTFQPIRTPARFASAKGVCRSETLHQSAKQQTLSSPRITTAKASNNKQHRQRQDTTRHVSPRTRRARLRAGG